MTKPDEETREEAQFRAEEESEPESFADYSAPPTITITVKDRKDKVHEIEMGIPEAEALWGYLGNAIKDAQGK